MKINNINPYIRFAMEINYNPINDYLCAADYHFYYASSNFYGMKINEKKYNINPGTVIIIPPGTKYCFKSAQNINTISINFDYTQNHAHITNGITPVSVQNFDKENIVETVWFEDYSFLNDPIILENMSYIMQNVAAVLHEHTYKKQFYAEVSSAIFKNILMEIIRHITLGRNNNQTINKILDYIHRHYCDEINNKLLADIAGYHPTHLNRLMKKSTGTTLRQYIINYRIEMSKQFLRGTNFTILEISEMCGYKNFCNFSCDFKRKTGLAPTYYRTQVKYFL